MAGAFARRFSPAPAAHNASSSIPSCAGPPVPTRASASGSPCVWIVPRGRFPFLPTSPQLCAVPRKQSELSPASRPLYDANFSAGCSPRARSKRAHDASRAASRTSSPAPAANRAGASHARLESRRDALDKLGSSWIPERAVELAGCFSAADDPSRVPGVRGGTSGRCGSSSTPAGELRTLPAIFRGEFHSTVRSVVAHPRAPADVRAS